MVWSWEGCSAHTRAAGLPCCRSKSSEQGTETFTAPSISKVCGKCLCFTFSLSHSLKDCETHKWLVHVGTKSGSPEGGEQKVHHGHQRPCPGRKPLSAVLQNPLALPCVEQSSRLAARWKRHFFQLKNSWTKLMHFPQLQSWPLRESPLPLYHLDANESLNSWMKGMCKERTESSHYLWWCSIERGGWERRRWFSPWLPFIPALKENEFLNPNAETPIKKSTKLWQKSIWEVGLFGLIQLIFFIYFLTANELSLAFFKGHLFLKTTVLRKSF